MSALVVVGLMVVVVLVWLILDHVAHQAVIRSARARLRERDPALWRKLTEDWQAEDQGGAVCTLTPPCLRRVGHPSGCARGGASASVTYSVY